MWPALAFVFVVFQAPSFKDTHVKVRASAEPVSVAVGAATRIVLAFDVDPGWHIYPHDFEGIGNKTVIEPSLPVGFGLGEWVWPKPKQIDSFGEKVSVHEGVFTVSGNVAIGANVKPGEYELPFLLHYQVCSNVCLDRKTPVTVKIQVTEKGANAPVESRSSVAAPVKDGPIAGVLTEETKPYEMSVQFELSKGALRPSEEAVVFLRLTIDPGFHTYAPTSPANSQPLTIEATGFELVGKPEGPTPKSHYDELLKITQLQYDSDVTLTQRVRAPATGIREAPTMTLTGIVCDATTCKPPATWTARFDVQPLTGGVGAGSKIDTRKQEPTGLSRDRSVDDSTLTTGSLGSMTFGGFLLASAFGGWASLFTPCVFPMIPITVSFFAKRAGKRRGRAVGLATTYALGIIGTFTLIGVLVSLLFGATGLASFATNPWVNFAMGGLFVVLGLSLLGLFQIAAPSGLTNMIEEAKGEAKNDWVMTLLMAMAFTLASFTCTVPVLGALLGLSAQGSTARPIAGMLAYSTTFAAPFFLLALFPTVLQKLPRGGAWLEVVKISMGFVELAAALKFLSNADIGADWQILTRPLFLAIWIATFLALSLYLFGILRMAGAEGEVGAIRAVFGVGSMSIALYLFAGLFGMSYGPFIEGFLPKPGYGGQGISQQSPGAPLFQLTWFEDLDDGLREGKLKNRWIFLNFTGDQCVNCRGMEQGMFPRPAVSAELVKMTLIELVLDRESTPELAKRSARYREYEEKTFDSTARPLYVILEPDGKTVVTTYAGSTTDEGEFIRFLRGEKIRSAK